MTELLVLIRLAGPLMQVVSTLGRLDPGFACDQERCIDACDVLGTMVADELDG